MAVASAGPYATICTSLQTDNHTNTSSLNFYRPDALPDAQPVVSKHWRHAAHTHTHLTALFPGLPGWAGTRKIKTNLVLLKQETVSGSGISWAICKSAHRSRQTTTPAPQHSVTQHWSYNIITKYVNQEFYITATDTRKNATTALDGVHRCCG